MSLHMYLSLGVEINLSQMILDLVVSEVGVLTSPG